MPIDKAKVEKGRMAVNAYRTAHTKLYEAGWRRTIPEEHTPLLNTMLDEFKKQGFSSIEEFFDASDLLNIQELGFASREDFNAEVKKGSTSHIEVDPLTGKEVTVMDLTNEGKALLTKIDGMWH